MDKNKTLKDIVEKMRGMGNYQQYSGDHARELAYRIEAAAKQEANSVERLVRDAIIDYQEMYAHAPNDDAERELKERAARGNAWLVAHGFAEEKVIWSKEETLCL